MYMVAWGKIERQDNVSSVVSRTAHKQYFMLALLY